jgi:ABC-type multidrug transport system fused ATPase/permease subunit
MAMPSGESPQHAKEFYEYLLAHHQTERPVKTWYIEWLSVAWMWGFLAALAVILVLWIRQNRTTRQKTGIYAIDTWSGFTSEVARPASLFFIVLSGILVGFAVAMIVGHLVNGQIF